MRTEIKAAAASTAAGVTTGVGLVPLILWIAQRLGEDATDPLTVAAAGVLSGLIIGGVSRLAGWLRSSRTSTRSSAFDPVSALEDDAAPEARATMAKVYDAAPGVDPR